MKRYFAAAAGLLAGCATTSASLKEGGPFIHQETDKSVQSVSSCISEQWTRRSGSTNMGPRPQGVSLTLSYVVYSSTVAAVTVDIDDQGANRIVNVYARKGDRSDKLRSELSACL